MIFPFVGKLSSFTLATLTFINSQFGLWSIISLILHGTIHISSLTCKVQDHIHFIINNTLPKSYLTVHDLYTSHTLHPIHSSMLVTE